MKATEKIILDRLTEVRKECSVSVSPNDTNLNLITEEIDRLACIYINHLITK